MANATKNARKGGFNPQQENKKGKYKQSNRFSGLNEDS